MKNEEIKKERKFLSKSDRNKSLKVFTIKLKSFFFKPWRELKEVTIIDRHIMWRCELRNNSKDWADKVTLWNEII